MFFNLLNYRCVLEQNIYFGRTHFDGYILSYNLPLQTEMEIKLLTYLLPHLLTDFIRAPARTVLGKFAGLKYHKNL